MPDEDREEAHIKAVAQGIRQMIDGPASADDVDQVIEAVMGDELAAEDPSPGHPDSRQP